MSSASPRGSRTPASPSGADAEVAAAQGAEAGEAHQHGRRILELGPRRRIAAEVDPPCRGRVAAIGAAAALAPQPVADADTGVDHAPVVVAGHGLAPDVPAQRAAGVQAEVAARFGIPGLIAGASGNEGFVVAGVSVAQ
ncbi:hypothetical protein X973_15620, partial [Piscirickettsia salmonis]